MIATRWSLLAVLVSATLIGCSGEPPKTGPKETPEMKAKLDAAHVEAKKKMEENKGTDPAAAPK